MYGTVKIGYKGAGNYNSRYFSYKRSLCLRVADMKRSNVTYQISNLDCDYTEIKGNCLYSFINVEDIPLKIEICKNRTADYCKIHLKRNENLKNHGNIQ